MGAAYSAPLHLLKRNCCFVLGGFHFCPQEHSMQSATLEPRSAFGWLWESVAGVKHCSKIIKMSMLSFPEWVEQNNVNDLSLCGMNQNGAYQIWMAQSVEKPVTSEWEILSYLSRTTALMALQRTINNAKDQQLHSHSQATTAPIRCAGLKRAVGFLLACLFRRVYRKGGRNSGTVWTML